MRKLPVGQQTCSASAEDYRFAANERYGGPHPVRGRLAARGRRLRGHPLRTGGRDRQDHHRPPRGPQRLPARDPDRDVRRARARARGHGGGRDRPHRGGSARVLLRRRPARARRHRLRGRRRPGRAIPRDRPARADAPHAQADRRHGRRLCDRRRARAARGLRPHDRRRQRPLWPDRPEGGELRRRLRRQPARRPGRAEEGQGDLVPVPPVRRRGGARDGPGEHGRPARATRGGDRGVVPRDARALPLRAPAPEGELPRLRGWHGRPPAARARRQPPLLRQRGSARGPRGVQGKAPPGFRQVSEAAVSGLTGRAAAPRGTLRLWLLASRPRTLPAAIAPVLVGTSLAATEDEFSVLPFLAALVGSVFIQIGTNLSNDYSDARRGADTEDRLGPVRVTAGAGRPPRPGRRGAWGAVRPRPYGYEGLGEVFVFLFFGIVAVAGSYYAQVERLAWEAFVLAVPVGLIASAILVVNNTRALETDRRAGKRTLAVRLGRERSRVLYVAMVAGAFLTAPLPWPLGSLSGWLLLSWLAAPLAIPLVRVVRTRTDGPSLNAALAGTGRLQLAFCVLLSGGL